MTAVPVSAVVLNDRAAALHAAVDAHDAHRDECTKAWCARCEALSRVRHETYQSALNAAATVRSAR